MENVETGGQGRDDNIDAAAARGIGPDGQFLAKVNEIEVRFPDPIQEGAHILGKAGFVPPGDHVLIQLRLHSTFSIGLDEQVDLREPGTDTFRAFKSDRIFRFTLDEHGYDWGSPHISEPELRQIGDVSDDDVLILGRDGKHIELKPDDIVDLGHAGTEHLRTAKRLVTVFFDDVERKIPRGTYTTEQLKKEFGVEPGYILEFVNEEGHLTPLKPGEALRVKEGMKFFTQVPCGGSS
jgi:hypothetical protein